MTVVYRWMTRTARAGLGLMLMLSALAGMALAHPDPPPLVPEIDPGTIGSALTLLMGGVFLLTGRSRKG